MSAQCYGGDCADVCTTALGLAQPQNKEQCLTYVGTPSTTDPLDDMSEQFEVCRAALVHTSRDELDLSQTNCCLHPYSGVEMSQCKFTGDGTPNCFQTSANLESRCNMDTYTVLSGPIPMGDTPLEKWHSCEQAVTDSDKGCPHDGSTRIPYPGDQPIRQHFEPGSCGAALANTLATNQEILASLERQDQLDDGQPSLNLTQFFDGQFCQVYAQELGDEFARTHGCTLADVDRFCDSKLTPSRNQNTIAHHNVLTIQPFEPTAKEEAQLRATASMADALGKDPPEGFESNVAALEADIETVRSGGAGPAPPPGPSRSCTSALTKCQAAKNASPGDCYLCAQRFQNECTSDNIESFCRSTVTGNTVRIRGVARTTVRVTVRTTVRATTRLGKTVVPRTPTSMAAAIR